MVGSDLIYKEGAIVLLEEWPDSGVGCHFAPSNMHPFVYQRSRQDAGQSEQVVSLL